MFALLLQNFFFFCKIARKSQLNLDEKNIVAQKLGPGMSTLQISKELGRDHRSINKIAELNIQPKKEGIRLNS